MRPFAHADMIFHGWSMRLFQAWQHRRSGFEDPVRQPVVAHELPDMSTGFNSGDRGGSARTVMLSGIASRRQVPTGLIDDQHRWAPGSTAALISMRCAAMASVSTNTSPAPFPFAGQIAKDIGPFGALVAGRPRARATSGPSACELILLADAVHLATTALFDAFREPTRMPVRRGSFFKSLDGQLVLRVMAAPRSRSRAPSTQKGLANVRHRARFAPPAHDAVRRDRAGLSASARR